MTLRVGIGFGSVVIPPNHAPGTPTITGGTITTSTWALSSNAFSDIDDDDTHLYTDWEVASDASFSTIVWSSLDDTVNLTSIIASGLSSDTQYWARCRHADNHSLESNDSTAISDTTEAVSGTTPQFADGFETGDFTGEYNGWNWYNGVKTSVVTAADGDVYGLDWSPRTGTYALRFRYPVAADSWSELRFDMGVNTSEFWMEYYLKYPELYHHRSDSPNNNKFIFFWDDGDYPGGVPDGQISCVINTWRNAAAGKIAYSSIGVRGDTGKYPGGISNYTDHITEADREVYRRFRYHLKLSSDGSTADGALEIWKDATKIYDETNVIWYCAAKNYFRTGYLMGYHNSGYDNVYGDGTSQHILVDDFKFYISDPGW